MIDPDRSLRLPLRETPDPFRDEVTAIDPRQSLKIIFAVAIGIILALFATLQRYESGPHVPPAGPDTLVFYMYARSMAEGYPYRLYREDEPTTGSTSHLFPAVLALAYALGAKGKALSTATFALDGVFYLAVIAGVWFAARRLYERAAPLATALTLLSGHIVYNLFYQHDMGLFAPLAIGALCAALARRPLVLGILLVLATLTRPEGMMLSFLLLVVSFLPVGDSRRPEWKFAAAGAAGLASFGAVLLLNHYLTGYFQFTSIIGKGVVGSDSGIVVLKNLAEAWRETFLGLVFGIGDQPLRMQQLIVLPVLGGTLALIGLASRPWMTGKHSRLEIWWVLGLLGTTVMVSTAGPIGNYFDRYYTWVLPFWFIYIGIGACELAGLAAGRRVLGWLALLLIGYQLVGLFYFGSLLNIGTAQLATQREFVRRVNDALPEGSRIGTEATFYAAYDLTRHKVLNIWGLVSPEFVYSDRSAAVNVEVLREEPQTRFDYWIVNATNVTREWYSPFIGEPIDAQLPLFSPTVTMVVHRADWSSLEASHEPRSPIVKSQLAGLELVDELNIGYVPHEKRSDYEVSTRVPGAYLPAMSETLKLGEQSVTEAGRVVLGGESMTLRAQPGRDVVMVLRTSMLGRIKKGSGEQRFGLESHVSLKVWVDEEEAGEFSLLLKDAAEFTEVAFRIPGELIHGEQSRIRVVGDHISYAYWFYQEPARTGRGTIGTQEDADGRPGNAPRRAAS